MKAKITTIVVFLMLSDSWFGTNLFAELTRTDIKEEIQHVDKRIDDLRDTLRTEIGALKSEISDVKTANKDIKSEIKDVRAELKDVRGEIKDVRADIKDVRTKIKEMRSELQNFMLWGFGIVFTGIFALIGFVLWDRRTALAPAIRKSAELEEREYKVEQALKEYAKGEPRLKEILKHVGLM